MIKAHLSTAHREVIEGLMIKFFQVGEQGLLETLTGYLQNIRKYYHMEKKT